MTQLSPCIRSRSLIRNSSLSPSRRQRNHLVTMKAHRFYPAFDHNIAHLFIFSLPMNFSLFEHCHFVQTVPLCHNDQLKLDTCLFLFSNSLCCLLALPNPHFCASLCFFTQSHHLNSISHNLYIIIHTPTTHAIPQTLVQP